MNEFPGDERREVCVKVFLISIGFWVRQFISLDYRVLNDGETWRRRMSMRRVVFLTRGFAKRARANFPERGGHDRPRAKKKTLFNEDLMKVLCASLRCEPPNLSVRLVDAERKQVGVMSGADALVEAKAKSLDVVLVNKRAQPPVVGLVDAKEHTAKEMARGRELRKKQKAQSKKNELKEVRIGANISSNDLMFKVKRARSWLSKNNTNVRCTFTQKRTSALSTEERESRTWLLLEAVTEAMSDVGQEMVHNRKITEQDIRATFRPLANTQNKLTNEEFEDVFQDAYERTIAAAALKRN